MDSATMAFYFAAKYLTYREYFALADFLLISPVIGILAGTSILLNYFGNKRNSGSVSSHASLLRPNADRRDQPLNLLQRLSSCLAWLAFAIITFYSSLLLGFRIISLELYYSLAIAIFSTYFIINYSKLKRSKGLMLLSSLFTVVVILIAPVLFRGVCQIQATFPNGVTRFLFSTSFTREFTQSEACPVGPPCHVYATLPENASDSVFINFHTNIKYTEAVVCYNATAEKGRNPSDTCVSTQVVPFKEIEWIGQRLIHTVYLKDLRPDTVYRISIRYDSKLQKEELYQTLPLHPTSSRSIKIVTGGDAGFMEMSVDTGRQAAKQKPDLVVIGGDLAYDNGQHTCYDAWDQFIAIFEYMNKVKGMLIPIIFTIGNHDVGIESLTIRSVTKGEDGPPFFTFFPQHSKVGSNGQIIKEIPSITERSSYFHHIIGGTLHVSLDCGYLAPYNGTQLDWLKDLNNKYMNLPKFAVYHVPIYWAFGLWDPVASVIVMSMQHWVPEFDRSRYMSAWENHAHLMKRTKLMRGGMPAENGTLYIGEGCWGVYCLKLPLENSTGIFERFENRMNHFWLIELQNEMVSYKAIDSKGRQVDETLQRYDSYLN